jgi:dTDP-4-dehydrorhamnose reductase
MIDLIFEHNGELDDIRGVYHVSNKGRASWYEYAKTIIKLVNISDVAVNCISSYELKSSVARPEFSILNNSKFEKMTGFSMRPWQEALAEYLRGKEADKRTKAMNLK